MTNGKSGYPIGRISAFVMYWSKRATVCHYTVSTLVANIADHFWGCHIDCYVVTSLPVLSAVAMLFNAHLDVLSAIHAQHV